MDGNAFQIIASDDDFGAGPTKVCNTCGEDKLLVEYHQDMHSPDGHKKMCKSCKSKYDKARQSPKPPGVSNDMIKNALEAAAYRIIKESM